MAKKILYCIGACRLTEDEDKGLGKVTRTLLEFKKHDNIEVDVCFFPDDLDQWRKVDMKASNELFNLIAQEDGLNVLRSTANFDLDAYDAYYGDASPLVLKMTEKKKPAMLASRD